MTSNRIPPLYRVKIRQGHDIEATVYRTGDLTHAVDAFVKTMLHPPNNNRYVELWEDDHLSIQGYPGR